jgi:maltooligosyltrehalose synthase
MSWWGSLEAKYFFNLQMLMTRGNTTNIRVDHVPGIEDPQDTCFKRA